MIRGFVAAICLAMASTAFSEEKVQPGAKATTVSLEKGQVGEVKEVGNKLCPITGDPVATRAKAVHVDYKGYRVALCCEGCKKLFLAKADENLAKAQANAAETTGTAAKQAKPEKK